jgi:signal transduction histidine kinase
MARRIDGSAGQPPTAGADLHVLECVSAPPPSATRQRRHRVLVADDSKLERADIVRNLNSVGNLEIFEASNGAEAISAVEKHQPDLVLCDQEMPMLGGLQALQILRLRWSRFELPFLMLTAHQDTEEKVTAFRFGANDYVTKPARPEELVARVYAHLNLKTAIEGAREARSHLMLSGRLQMVGRVAGAIAHDVGNSVEQVSGQLQVIMEALEAQQRLLHDLRDRIQRSDPQDQHTWDALKTAMHDPHGVLHRQRLERARSAIENGMQHIAACCEGVQDFAIAPSDERVCIDLNRAVENTLRVAAPAWQPHATLSWDLDPALPPVECVDGQVKQAILSMALNAAEAVRGQFGEGPRNGRIAIGTRSVGSGVEIRISDNGPGVPVALRDQIFEPFFSTKQPGSSSGLGLSFAFDVIVRHHGGSITCEKSTLGGACFRAFLPFGQQQTLDLARA